MPSQNVDSSHNIFSQKHMSSHELLQRKTIASGCFVSCDIKCACVNVCGLKSKLKTPEFHEFLRKSCFICVSKTKFNDLDIPTVLDNIPEDYTTIFKNRYSLITWGGGGGGILLLYSMKNLQNIVM